MYELELRMKILLIFTFCLITVGDGSSLEVTGYSGGGVLIKCKNQPATLNPKYFCRASGSNCTELIKTEDQDKWRTTGRFSLLYNSSAEELWVFIPELTVDDSGWYQCGGDEDSVTSVNLNVTEDPLFGKSLSVTGHAGEVANISCKYPQSYKTESKFLCKRDNNARCKSKVYVSNGGKWITKEPYSVYDNREQQIFTVTINNLTEENSGEYWCAIQSNDGNKLYITQINLTVIGPASSLITAVCVIVLLLLIGLLFFIIILRKRNKTQNTASTPSQSLQDSSNSHTVSHAVCDYEEIKDSRHLSGSSKVFSTPQLATKPSDPSQSFYGNVQSATSPCDSSHPLHATQTPSISSDHAQQSSGKSAEGPTYTTLNFSKTSSCDATVTARTFKKEEDTCDYATVKHVIGSG